MVVDKMKKEWIIIIVLLIVCSLLSMNLLKTKKELKSPDKVAIKEVKSPSDFDKINYQDSFDVSDFADQKQNTIDLNSKSYKNNKITITDSDFQISDKLQEKVYKTINDYGVSNSFYIVSLNDGMTIGYNVDKRYETASSIKAPYALYVYKEAAKGNIDLNREIIYEKRFYNKGTGVIRYSDFGTPYKVKDLVYYSLTDSDNIAHQMLHRTFGVKGYNQMLKNLGTKELYLTASNPWGYTSCRSSALIWQEIYNFAIREQRGIELLNILTNGKYNYYKEIMPGIPSASKAGFANRDVIETGIVFDKSPYIAIAVANKGGNLGAYTQVLELINNMNDIMNEYNEYLEKK